MLTNSIFIVTIILAAILLVPLLCEKIHIPGIVGLILTGLLVGPYGLGLIEKDASIDVMGQLGMLYLMFISGIEIDMDEFRMERHKSIAFGVLTYAVPSVLGLLVARYGMNFSWPSAILLSAMLGSHTLMTYPVVSRYGVQSNKAVSIAIGATIFAVTLSMLVLAGISSVYHDTINQSFWLRLILGVPAMAVCIFWVYPRLTAWFFRRFNDSIVEFVFVLVLAAAAGVLSLLAGLEPILGIFLAGLALNRQIPNLSPLMNKITFVGNAIFIPVFLLSVGMLINLSVFTSSLQAWGVAGIMCVLAIAGKWLAAWLAQRSMHLSAHQRRLLFGLTNSHAAGALAMVMIGYAIVMPDGNRLFGEDVLNATVLLILLSCAISSFLTEHAAKHIALEDVTPAAQEEEGSQRILLSVANAESNKRLVEMASLLMNKEKGSSLHALAVVRSLEENAQAERLLEQTAKECAAAGRSVLLHRQVAVNISNGIRMVATEQHMTHIVLGATLGDGEKGYGKVVNPLLTTLGQSLWITHLTGKLLDCHHVRILLPEHADAEPGYAMWRSEAERMARALQAELLLEVMTDWQVLPRIAASLSKDEILVVMQARRSTVSYVPEMEQVPAVLQKHFADKNYLVVFPHQDVTPEQDNALLSEYARHTESTYTFIERLGSQMKKHKTRGKKHRGN